MHSQICVQLRLRVTVCYCACAVRACNSEMCARLWRQFFFIAEVTSNRWNGLQFYKERAGRLETFYRDKHPVREILGVLLAWSGEKRMAMLYEQPSLVFPTAAKRTRSKPPSSQLKNFRGCCQAGLLALSDCKIWRQKLPTWPWTLMPLPTLACCNQALRSYQLEGTHIAVIRRFCCMSLASSCAEDKGNLYVMYI